jgi:hypothetical protein
LEALPRGLAINLVQRSHNGSDPYSGVLPFCHVFRYGDAVVSPVRPGPGHDPDKAIGPDTDKPIEPEKEGQTWSPALAKLWDELPEAGKELVKARQQDVQHRFHVSTVVAALRSRAGWTPDLAVELAGYWPLGLGCLNDFTEKAIREEWRWAEEAEAKAREWSGLPLLWFGQIEAVLDAGDFVQGVLTRGSSIIVYGESNSGKTFWVVDLALHIAAGLRWNGRRVDQGAVIYVAMEGGVGFRNRVAAWRTAHADELLGQDIPFVAIPAPLNMLDPAADTQKLIDAVLHVAKRMGLPVCLVVLDTVARAIAGGNENASDDMGALVNNVDRVRAATGAAVLGVHHSGKDAARGARGWSGLRGAIDTEIEVRADDETKEHSAEVVKQRDLPKGDAFTFRLQVHQLGVNQHKEPVTTCVVDSGDGEASPVKRKKVLPAHARTALRALQNLLAKGKGMVGCLDCPPGLRSIQEREWREEYYATAVPGASPEAKKKAFRRAADVLIDGQAVAMAHERCWIVADAKHVHNDNEQGDISEES